MLATLGGAASGEAVSSILIVYASLHGQTVKIARHIADALASAGEKVTLADARELPRSMDLSRYDAVVVGSPLVLRRHLPAVERFVRRHRNQLQQLPTAFFSVSASAASPASMPAARRALERFLAKTDWRPPLTACIAGAITYTRYSPLLRYYMAWASRRYGGPSDPSRDYEFTDWPQVDGFARRLRELVSHKDRPDRVAEKLP